MSKRKRSFKQGLKASIRSKLGIPLSKSDKLIEKDPYLLLGYGINSYFQIMIQLITLFIILSCMAIPLMVFYSQFSGTYGQVGYLFSQFSMGNMGGASSYCVQTRFNQKKSSVILQCTTGLLDLDAVSDLTEEPIFDVGIIPRGAELTNYCEASSFTDQWDCSSYIKKDKLINDIREECAGKTACKLTNLP